jgi:hypothetical protein
MTRRILLVMAAIAALAAPASAQIGLGGGGIGGQIGGLGGRLPGTLGGPLGTIDRTAGGLNQNLRGVTQAAQDLVGRPLNSRVLGRDERGAPIVRGEVLAVSPGEASLAAARQLGFTVLRQDRLESLGLSSVTLQAPDGMDAIAALAALRGADPGGDYDYAHVYNPSGAAVGAVSSDSAAPMAASLLCIGMIDGAVETHHPALNHAAIVAQGFAGKGDAAGSVHGTAIASLLVGQDGNFSGYLPGAKLYVADVFGGAPDGGSAAEIARALNWMAANNIAVTNISLTGPPNALLAAAVKSFLAGGHLLVAAVGNDGPAAPPNYPAAYPGVVAVTSVDKSGHLQLDANGGTARFAALGVSVRAANLPRGYAAVTGTSYAAPAIAARFALLLASPDRERAKIVVDQLIAVSTRLNITAPAPVYLPPVSAGETAASQ